MLTRNRVISILIFGLIVIMVSGCFEIIGFDQPENLQTGENVELTMNVKIAGDDGTPHYGIVAILIPNDWVINTVAIEGDYGSHTCHYLDYGEADSELGAQDYWADSLEVRKPSSDDYRWAVYETDTSYASGKDPAYADIKFSITVGTPNTQDLIYFVSSANLDFTDPSYYSFSDEVSVYDNPVTVILKANVGGETYGRSFWAAGSWNSNFAYDASWSGPLVELKDDGQAPDEIVGDGLFTGSVTLEEDSTNQYAFWVGFEEINTAFLTNSPSTIAAVGTDTIFMSSFDIKADPADSSITDWTIGLAGDMNNWKYTLENLQRDGTVCSGTFTLEAGITYSYRYYVMHSYYGYGSGGIGFGDPTNAWAYAPYTFECTGSGEYLFSFNDADNSQSVTLVTAVETNPQIAPVTFSLSQNYPNPFNGATMIKYSLAKDSDVEIAIYDLVGRKVRTLLSDYHTTGSWHVIWDSKDEIGAQVASGVYLYRIKAGEFTATAKMLFVQ